MSDIKEIYGDEFESMGHVKAPLDESPPFNYYFYAMESHLHRVIFDIRKLKEEGGMSHEMHQKLKLLEYMLRIVASPTKIFEIIKNARVMQHELIVMTVRCIEHVKSLLARDEETWHYMTPSAVPYYVLESSLYCLMRWFDFENDVEKFLSNLEVQAVMERNAKADKITEDLINSTKSVKEKMEKLRESAKTIARCDQS